MPPIGWKRQSIDERGYDTIVGSCGHEPNRECFSCSDFPDCPYVVRQIRVSRPQKLHTVPRCSRCTVIECPNGCVG